MSKTNTLRLVLFMAALCWPVGCTANTRPDIHSTALRLDFDLGTCSGTAVAPHAILTAAHCLEGGELATVNGLPAHVGQAIEDGSDHVLLIVDRTFTHYAHIAPGMRQTQRVRFYGNPDGIPDMYREGVVAGTEEGVILIDCTGWFGDSGSGLFDTEDNLIGVVSVKLQDFAFMGAYPLSFSAGQYKDAGI